MFKLLFVCTGNTCRSPIAEYLFRQMLKDEAELKDRWEIFSAGINAVPGIRASINAVKVLEEEGIDLKDHVSTQLDHKMLKDMDLVLTMTKRHKKIVRELVPEFNDRIYTLKEFAGLKEDLDIVDPFGQSEEVYRRAKEEIKKILKMIISQRNHSIFQAGKAEKKENYILRGDKKLRVVLGCDHAGLDIKKEIINLLKEEEIEYFDIGTNSNQSVDYPDFAYKAANGVADGRYDRGILICGTGIGMSIAANKVPGIRAALCHDVFSAKATRKHNDANVLTMGSRVIGAGLALEIVEAWLGTEFEGGRHQRRIDKIAQIERGEYKDNE